MALAPRAPEPGEDVSGEPLTLAVFEFTDVPGGTLLTVVESAFDQIPLVRRAKPFRDHEDGWAAQTA